MCSAHFKLYGGGGNALFAANTEYKFWYIMKGNDDYYEKIISLLVVLILVISCPALVVSVAPSPEVDDIVSVIEATDKGGKRVSIVLTKSDTVDNELKPTNTEEALMGQYDVEIKGSPEYPVTVRARMAGVKTTSKVYILTKEADGTVNKVIATVTAEDQIEFKLDSDCKVLAVIADKKTATNIGTSDKTDDSTFSAVMTVLCLAVVVGAVSVKRIKA